MDRRPIQNIDMIEESRKDTNKSHGNFFGGFNFIFIIFIFFFLFGGFGFILGDKE
ncbi:hypothetical protein L0P54_02460 [Anaerosalibacter bizertensis]|uniref:Uncharacterized protein n=1 Tax=Anaerosalibacter bizertensis TaxID=932217 RepID=A0A9Q4AAH9_9FIRM|nr:hypothetical protein [Anaerosalibacter bizertensis]MBV1817432.1 hypothetical protein [Bacteroidales bacterium MSK.15.36]MCB5559268.1 hypothetical protein [Anaerosalibacter bizertensis]MCG4564056.1 hypothetical protein [Anaerosalibacter bizertensis]MCG4581836.1 hypothetical protein [Anaerosalibacter bizertensis]MCG4585141.1 hypothetical protein [Anaerosalibacter bizertensis]